VIALEGSAEALPLATGSADAACAGQAFHWFDADRALEEFARVLRPRGIAIAAWNTPPDDGTWYDAVIDFLSVANPDHLPATEIDWAAALGAHPRFGGLLEIAARHEQHSERAAFRRLLGTHSMINVLPPARRSELIDGALAVAEERGAFDEDGNCLIPWRCELFVLQRRT
jgi:SAM-dependent methyltransferase